jgi:hypothetical protein
MFEGDIIRYNLDPYGAFDLDVDLRINEVCDQHYIIVSPLNGVWPDPFFRWELKQKLSTRYILDTLYTIEPKTPPRTK